MAMTGLDTFDTTVEKTNVWLKDIMESQGWNDRNKAYLALRAVLQTLRDRLPPEEAAHLAAELPMLVRGIFFEGWSPANKPIKMDRDAFMEEVERAFPDKEEIDPEKIVTAVFAVLEKRISEGEISEIKGVLPKDLREFWGERGEEDKITA